MESSIHERTSSQQLDSPATNLQFLRGGTSGTHARHFSEIEPHQVKNKSFFNKYKESKKESINYQNTSLGDIQSLSLKYNRPRTNSPFPHMRATNLQVSQFNQELIAKLNYSANLKQEL